MGLQSGIRFYIIREYLRKFFSKSSFPEQKAMLVILMLRHPYVVWMKVWLNNHPVRLGWGDNIRSKIFGGIKRVKIFLKLLKNNRTKVKSHIMICFDNARTVTK